MTAAAASGGAVSAPPPILPTVPTAPAPTQAPPTATVVQVAPAEGDATKAAPIKAKEAKPKDAKKAAPATPPTLRTVAREILNGPLAAALDVNTVGRLQAALGHDAFLEGIEREVAELGDHERMIDGLAERVVKQEGRVAEEKEKLKGLRAELRDLEEERTDRLRKLREFHKKAHDTGDLATTAERLALFEEQLRVMRSKDPQVYDLHFGGPGAITPNMLALVPAPVLDRALQFHTTHKAHPAVAERFPAGRAKALQVEADRRANAADKAAEAAKAPKAKEGTAKDSAAKKDAAEPAAASTAPAAPAAKKG